MNQFLNIATLITAIGVLVAIVNIFTEVLKKILPSSIPSSLLAVVISLIITTVSLFAYCSINTIAVLWYYIVGAIVVGFMVSYAAMFGFDKLKEILQGLKSNTK